jgi:hypothetical protein
LPIEHSPRDAPCVSTRHAHWHTYIHARMCTNGHPMGPCKKHPVQVVMKIIVTTGSVKSSSPIATVIKPTWQQLNVAMGAVMTSTRCYCDICVKIRHLLLPFTTTDCQQNLLHRIFPLPALACVIPHSEITETKPPYVCLGCLIHTYSNNMINKCHIQ